MWNLTCNTTLEELRVGSEVEIVHGFTFHRLAIIVGGGCAVIATLTSLYLVWMHALNYTKPREQKHIIRILFMIPIYSISAFLCIWKYWHAVYYQVISDCYEAFAISSFFALMCHYVAPDLHEQKEYFRYMSPMKPWVWPVNWFAKCCGGDLAMTITAVITEYFDRYCETSNNPVFAHIWVLILESLAVTIAMYCLIQFYIQMKEPLAEHKPFLKVLAIKLVIFLSFWQTTAISVGTSTLGIIQPNEVLAYPDLKVGIPSLLLCFEMAVFAILHIWAFPYQPYVPGAKASYYPPSDPALGLGIRENERGAPKGGFMGLMAILDALNLWDVIKSFGRGIRWLFVGVKKRHNDISYSTKVNSEGVDTSYPMRPYGNDPGTKSTDHLPIATEFRRSQFGMPGEQHLTEIPEENAALIDNVQGISGSPPRRGRDASPPYRDPYTAGYYDGPLTAPPNSAVRPYQPYPGDNGDLGEAMRPQHNGTPYRESERQYYQRQHRNGKFQQAESDINTDESWERPMG
ncbi:Transmembrane protein [Apiospora phragmitis]|uniref:Transmembrane protein n=1 Tax=Apiospora phragmitis TaxID=2905665 RepID=A0ABR1X613_9PEZI